MKRYVTAKMIGLNRLDEHVDHLVNALVEDDRDSAIEFFYDNGFTIEELSRWGIELTEEELEMYDWERMCPVCGEIYSEYPALSRRDNATYICPECGTNEALEDYFGGDR